MPGKKPNWTWMSDDITCMDVAEPNGSMQSMQHQKEPESESIHHKKEPETRQRPKKDNKAEPLSEAIKKPWKKRALSNLVLGVDNSKWLARKIKRDEKKSNAGAAKNTQKAAKAKTGETKLLKKAAKPKNDVFATSSLSMEPKSKKRGRATNTEEDQPSKKKRGASLQGSNSSKATDIGDKVLFYGYYFVLHGTFYAWFR